MIQRKIHGFTIIICLLIFFCGCAEISPTVQNESKKTTLHGRVTTTYYEQTVRTAVSTGVAVSRGTTLIETSTVPQKNLLPKAAFPTGKIIHLKPGQVFEIAPCKKTEIDLTQILVSGGDLGSKADIICVDKDKQEKKAHFTCSGNKVEFRTDLIPYQLICINE